MPSDSMQRRRASRSPTGAWASTASIIWVSTRRTGFKVIIGSWKIMAIRAPRRRRSRSSLAPTSSSPLKRTLPSTMRPGGSTSPRIEKPVIDLPLPALADEAQDLAFADRDRHPVDREDFAAARVEPGLEALDLEHRLADRAHLQRRSVALGRLLQRVGAHVNPGRHRCSLGFRMSRSWSPTRLMQTMVTRSATPGKKLIQYWPDRR